MAAGFGKSENRKRESPGIGGTVVASGKCTRLGGRVEPAARIHRRTAPTLQSRFPIFARSGRGSAGANHFRRWQLAGKTQNRSSQTVGEIFCRRGIFAFM